MRFSPHWICVTFVVHLITSATHTTFALRTTRHAYTYCSPSTTTRSALGDLAHTLHTTPGYLRIALRTACPSTAADHTRLRHTYTATHHTHHTTLHTTPFLRFTRTLIYLISTLHLPFALPFTLLPTLLPALRSPYALPILRYIYWACYHCYTYLTLFLRIFARCLPSTLRLPPSLFNFVVYIVVVVRCYVDPTVTGCGD